MEESQSVKQDRQCACSLILRRVHLINFAVDKKLLRRKVRHTIVFILKLDWSVCICLTQLYDGRDMYRIYYIKNNYMFRHFTLAIFRLRNEKTL